MSRPQSVCVLLLCVASAIWFNQVRAEAAGGTPQVSHFLESSVVSSAGAICLSPGYVVRSTLAQATPVGMGSAAGKTVCAGFWSSAFATASILQQTPDERLETRLYQNFPNPFITATAVRYSLARESNVEIAVFNIRGQKIRTLVNQTCLPGTHYVVWDGKDSNGHRLPAGVYFCRLDAGAHMLARKMLVIN